MSLFKYNIFSLLLVIGLLTSCKKFLDEKPDKSMNVPASLSDLQMLLDNYGIMNAAYPYAGEVMADNYYIAAADWSALSSPTLKNYYIWQKDDQTPTEWAAAYRVVFYSNVVLDHLLKIDAGGSEEQYNNCKGSALFYRAFAFYALTQLYAPPYDSATAAVTLGIPVRLSADFNKSSSRATLEQTYQQILSDLQEAVTLLPATPAAPNRPSKAAGYAALARTALAMESYVRAATYAAAALAINNTLIDYNTLNANAAIPIQRFNAEVIFPAVSTAPAILNTSRAKVDSNLYRSYSNNDLRKTVFYRSAGSGAFSFKGSYDGSNNGSVFSGLTTSELYLVLAESLARGGKVTEAMDALNTLLVKRFKTGTFVPLTASSPQEALNWVLQERRKELPFRGLRWTDLRRLNKDSRFAVTLYRHLGTQSYLLVPNSNGYTIQIPKTVIDLTGMPQNP